MNFPRTLIVEDEVHARLGLSATLVSLGHPKPVCCGNLATARQALGQGGLGLVLLDLRLPDGDGSLLLEEISVCLPDLPVIVISAVREMATVVRCLRAQAADFLAKPVDPAALEAAIDRTLIVATLQAENRALAQLARPMTLTRPEAFTGMATLDPEVVRAMRHAEICATAKAVLVTGEPGTGKSLLAEALHRLSGRSGAFQRPDAANLEQALAGDGTVELEHLTTMSPSAQAALVRHLRSSNPTGVIVTSSADLAACLRDGSLRADLHRLLCGHHLHLPPLRERPGDLAVLVHHLVARNTQAHAVPVPTERFIRACQARDWPGNISELVAAVDDAVGRGGELRFAHASAHPTALPLPDLSLSDPLPTLDQMRDLLVAEALRRSSGNLSAASRMLGITRWGLCKRLRQDH